MNAQRARNDRPLQFPIAEILHFPSRHFNVGENSKFSGVAKPALLYNIL
jgi:hypothetical protein